MEVLTSHASRWNLEKSRETAGRGIPRDSDNPKCSKTILQHSEMA